MREWSSSQVRTCASVPPASGQCVKSDCQVSLGSSASNLTYELRGLFLGSGSTSSQVRTCASVPPASGQCVKSDCQVSLGSSASNLTYELRGLFLGSGSTSPMSRRTRWMVDTDGTGAHWPSSTCRMLRAPQSHPWSCSLSRTSAIRTRWMVDTDGTGAHWPSSTCRMLRAPQSHPWSCSLSRTSAISRLVASPARLWTRVGLLERGSSPASPSAAYRRRRADTHWRLTRYVAPAIRSARPTPTRPSSPHCGRTRRAASPSAAYRRRRADTHWRLTRYVAPAIRSARPTPTRPSSPHCGRTRRAARPTAGAGAPCHRRRASRCHTLRHFVYRSCTTQQETPCQPCADNK